MELVTSKLLNELVKRSKVSYVYIKSVHNIYVFRTVSSELDISNYI